MVQFSTFANSAAIILSTALLVTSSPVAEIPATSINLQSRQLSPGLKPDDTKNKAEICGHPMTLNSQQQKDVWWQTRAVIVFDAVLGYKSGSGYKNWVRNLDMRITKKSQSGWDCATLVGGAGCGPRDLTCDPFFDEGDPWAFYVMWSVQKAHDMLSYFREKVVEKSILDFLQSDDLTKDYGHDPSGINPFGIVAGAFRIASGAAGLAGSGPAAGMTGIISGSFGIAGATYKPKDPNAKIKDMLGDFLEQSVGALDKTAHNLFGEPDGDQKQLPESALGPMQLITTSDQGHRGQYNEVAAFFADGAFLIDCVDCVYNDVVEKGNELLKQALGVKVLDSDANMIWVDTNIKDTGSCKGSKSHYWLNDMCFSLRKQPSSKNTDPINIEWDFDTISDDISGNMIDKYKTDMGKMYDNAYACRRDRKDGNFDLDAASIPYDGTLPGCFFSIDVKKGTWDKHTGNFKLVDL